LFQAVFRNAERVYSYGDSAGFTPASLFIPLEAGTNRVANVRE
jgi:hypothetical protein